MADVQNRNNNSAKTEPKKRIKEINPSISLLWLIFYPLILLIILAAIFGSTLISTLAIKKIEKRDHERIEAVEETIIEFLSSEENEKLYDPSYLIFLKEKIDFDISLYDQNGIIISSIEPGNPLRETPFEAKIVDDLLRGKVSHAHEHFSAGNNNFMVSYYPPFVRDNKPPFIFALTSSIHTFYDLRNQISLIVGLGIVAILGLAAIFLILFLKKYVTSPAKELIEVILKVRKGSLDVSLPEAPYGEIGDLTKNFSLMVSKLEEAKEKEVEVSKMRSEILSIAAHHLRTPLSAMKWGLKMILDGELGQFTSSEQQEMLEKAYHSNEQMITLVNDILDVSKIEEGHFGYAWSYEKVEDVIQEIINNFLPNIRQTGINLIYLKPKKSLPKVKVDLVKLRLAINNLLDNAIKYSAAGTNIKISLFYKKFEVIFSVEDTGIGIPKLEQAKLFSKFFRASNASILSVSGTGLGLFIANNIIEKHGGKLWFKSEEAKGSIFYFSLPVEKKFAPKEKYVEFLESV